ncbi:MAG: acylneuraminate cytidylyltransferase family protein [Rhizobiales bacterium]|nr:acylneuraminate cytidylyltransferase family protein [Hyphomicrobiales bacterium]
MIKDKKILAIILARGGSKRLPRKNVLPLNGKPLINYSIVAALNCNYIDATLVSSDDDEVLEISEAAGADIIKRPVELATDTSNSFDAIKHAIENYAKFDYIVLLQPTSPLRTSQHISQAIELLVQKQADAIISVCQTEHSPLWSNVLPKNHSMTNFIADEISNTRSQDLPTYYRLNGAIYIYNVKQLLAQETLLISKNIFAYVMDIASSVDIDTKIDFDYVEFLMSRKG